MNKILFDEIEIKKAIQKISNKILSQNNRRPNPPIFICILDGSFLFFSDLVKFLSLDIEIDFLKAKSYEGKEAKELKIIKDIELNIKGREIFLVDDIYDSGQTINKLIQHLEQFEPISITPIVLLKRQKSEYPLNLIYGLELKDDSFVVGYGMNDENNLGRNLPVIFGK